MKIKTADLIGPALDWAVSKCENEGVTIINGQLETRWTEDGWKPSTDWSQGGPIIEREKISTMWSLNNQWHACTGFSAQGHLLGPTPLIAAMRCYVASKLGDEVEIPEELL